MAKDEGNGLCAERKCIEYIFIRHCIGRRGCRCRRNRRQSSGGIDLPEEVATFHDTLFNPTEKTLTLRIKALVQTGDARGAERLLEMMPVSVLMRISCCVIQFHYVYNIISHDIMTAVPIAYGMYVCFSSYSTS